MFGNAMNEIVRFYGSQKNIDLGIDVGTTTYPIHEYTGQSEAMDNNGFDRSNITSITISGFYKHGNVRLVEKDNSVYVFGRYRLLLIIDNDAEDAVRQIAELNKDQYISFQNKGFHRTDWEEIWEHFNI